MPYKRNDLITVRTDLVSMEESVNERKSLIRIISGSAIIASMCCLPSVILVLFGLASVSSAAALSNSYWGENGYAWFRPTMLILAAIFVLIGLVIHFRSRGICTLDQAKRSPKNNQHLATGDNYKLHIVSFA